LSSVILIICLLLSETTWPKVITFSCAYCIFKGPLQSSLTRTWKVSVRYNILFNYLLSYDRSCFKLLPFSIYVFFSFRESIQKKMHKKDFFNYSSGKKYSRPNLVYVFSFSWSQSDRIKWQLLFKWLKTLFEMHTSKTVIGHTYFSSTPRL
jgi:hypothetical protein